MVMVMVMSMVMVWVILLVMVIGVTNAVGDADGVYDKIRLYPAATAPPPGGEPDLPIASDTQLQAYYPSP